MCRLSPLSVPISSLACNPSQLSPVTHPCNPSCFSPLSLCFVVACKLSPPSVLKPISSLTVVLETQLVSRICPSVSSRLSALSVPFTQQRSCFPSRKRLSLEVSCCKSYKTKALKHF